MELLHCNSTGFLKNDKNINKNSTLAKVNYVQTNDRNLYSQD